MNKDTPLLFIPGPVNVDESILLENAVPIINHRSEEFHKLFEDVKDLLKKVLNTKNEILIFTASGTGAVEALASNFAPRRRVLVINVGEFGTRLAEAFRVHGAQVEEISAELGSAPDLDTLRQHLDDLAPDILAFVYNDTSPGIRLSYIRELCMEARARDVLTLVDAVSAAGGDELDIDSWQIDALAGASQKCLGAPPGLSFLTLSDRAIEALVEKPSTVYFNVRRYLKYAEKSETPFTPAVTLFHSLRRALATIYEIGVDKWISMHLTRAQVLYKAFEDLSLKPFVKEPYRSRTVLAFRLPEAINVKDFRKNLKKKYGIEVAGGMGTLAESIIRVGVMGSIPLRDLITLVSTVGLELREWGLKVDLEKALEDVSALGRNVC
ncbi:MAG: alanine--glyoxylate aminotransferase family protein [Thermofilaceae archaeon]|nr:alanine--glyoxylate aminotransferase family protein [Thermofilaceae archaeon]MDW8003706.1 alanine--glyoxylate aminotransferase family protein [Thermofilaceae archaeon]